MNDSGTRIGRAIPFFRAIGYTSGRLRTVPGSFGRCGCLRHRYPKTVQAEAFEMLG